MTTNATLDHYLPDPVYRRLLGELAALQANQGHPRAVKFLAVAGIWSDAIRAETDALEVPAEM